MRLYSLQGASSVQDDEHGTFEVDADGVVEVPADLGAVLHGRHIGGQKAWETEAERHARLISEEIERRRDPAAMYELMEQLVAKQAADAPVAPDAPVITAPVDGATLTVQVTPADVPISGTVAQDGAVTIYDGDLVIATGQSAGGQFSADLVLAAGAHALSACVTVDGATSPWATPVTVNVALALPAPVPAPPAPPAAKKAPAKKAPAKKAQA